MPGTHVKHHLNAMTSESRRIATRLDPRSPLVIDTRELGRRPGSMRTLSRSFPAPGDLTVDVVGVPQGSPVDLDLRLESVMEGVLVSATAQAEVAGECVRCLDPITRSVEVSLQELYAYPGRERDMADDETELRRTPGGRRCRACWTRRRWTRTSSRPKR